jgi:hypothetical protein
MGMGMPPEMGMPEGMPPEMPPMPVQDAPMSDIYIDPETGEVIPLDQPMPTPEELALIEAGIA